LTPCPHALPHTTQVDEVKNIMSDNIEKVLSRGEKLDLLVDKTDNLMFEVRAAATTRPHTSRARATATAGSADLRARWPLNDAPPAVCVCVCVCVCARARARARVQADRFVKSGRALRRKMWWNNLKMKLVMGVAVVMVIVIIFLLICFGSGHSCVKRGDKAGSSSGGGSNASNSAPNGSSPAAAPASPPAASPAGGARRLLALAALDAVRGLAAEW
jgi:hypothetical protein